MIRHTRKGYEVENEAGTKRLGGPYRTRAEAEKRLREVEYYKTHGDKRDDRRARR